MAQRELMASLFTDDLALTHPRQRKDHLTFRGNRDRGRHGWLRLTPAYSVALVEQLIQEHSPTGRVLDPFCGSGTTALVCAQAGIPCDTIDINPFLVWLANVKCSSFSEQDIMQAKEAVRSAADSATDGAEVWVPPIHDISKWWEPERLSFLAHLLAAIKRANMSERARDLAYILFCRVMIEFASVSFGHQSMSFKRQAAQTPRLFDVSSSEQARTILERTLAEVLPAARHHLAATDNQAVSGDSRQVDQIAPHQDYSCVITSPPYPNRMSYIRELRPYMYWLGYLHTGRQAGELDWQAIGGTWGCATSNLQKWQPHALYDIPEPSFADAVATISNQSRVLGTYVLKYFQDIIPHVRSLRKVLAPGAEVHYIVGNSKFYDTMLHTERIYAAIFMGEGFQDVMIEPIRKRTSKRELFEFVVSARA